tara:strand:+ start:4832 stop:5965 length:1134 start_codon:yes stop_codon:yes gene_type:complete
MEYKPIILITDIFERKTFDVYNILKKSYCKNSIVLFLASSSNLLEKKTAKILYPSNNIYFSSTELDYDFEEFAKKYHGHKIVFFPIEESTIESFIIQKNKSHIIENNFNYLLPSLKTFSLVRNKKMLTEFCDKINFPIPKYYSEKQIKNNRFKYPLIIKPAIGSGSRGITHINSQKDNFKIPKSLKGYIIQEKIPNSSKVEACFVICKSGKIIQSYTHKRLLTFPKQGGVTLFSKLTDNQKIKSLSKDFVKQLNLEGLIMLEFLYCCKSDEYKLIEVNPRIWGSILLSDQLKNKFLKNYAEAAIGSIKNFNLKRELLKNNYIMWIFPYAFLFFLKNLLNHKKYKIYYVNITNTSFLTSFIFHLFIYSSKFFSRLCKR